MIKLMTSTFSKEELNSWAILDVHHYFAWGGSSGCTNGCSYKCSDSSTEEGMNKINDIVVSEASSSHAWLITQSDVPQIACSEYSLATFCNSNDACRSKNILKLMYDSQHEGFENQGLVAAFFWTWKMPYGGSHEASWSFKHYLGLDNGVNSIGVEK